MKLMFPIKDLAEAIVAHVEDAIDRGMRVHVEGIEQTIRDTFRTAAAAANQGGGGDGGSVDTATAVNQDGDACGELDGTFGSGEGI